VALTSEHGLPLSNVVFGRRPSWRVALRVFAVAAGILISATTCKSAGRAIFVLRNEDPVSAFFALLLPIVMPLPLLLGLFAPRVGGSVLCVVALGSAVALIDWIGIQPDKAAFHWNYVYGAVVVIGIALYGSGRRNERGAA
jgi:hypothetical protein